MSRFVSSKFKNTGAKEAKREPGKQGNSQPHIVAHSGAIGDLQFAPFADDLLASASDDMTIKVWRIPADGLQANLSQPERSLGGHPKRVEAVRWNPVAAGILAAASGNTVIVWNVESGERVSELAHPDVVQSLAWNWEGTQIATTSKDKKVRIFDARTGSPLQEGLGHAGLKGSRVVWMGTKPRLMTSGFDQTREREVFIYEASDLSKPLCRIPIGQGTGLLIPYYDADTDLFYLTAKGENTLYINEGKDAKPYYTANSAYTSPKPHTGACMLPKRAVDVMQAEVGRFFFAIADAIVPVSLSVPRKNTHEFAADLFPYTVGAVPGASASDWVAGSTSLPDRVSLDPVKAATSSLVALSLAQGQHAPQTSSMNQQPASADTPAKEEQAPDYHVPPPQKPAAQEPAPAPVPNAAPAPQPAPAQAPQPTSPPVAAAEPDRRAHKHVSVVRSSKFRHVAGALRHKNCNIEGISGLQAALPAESNVLAANAKFVAYPLAGPGGEIAVLRRAEHGPAEVPAQPLRLTDKPACVMNGSSVMDFTFCPYDPTLLVTGCEDSHVRVWRIPEDGLAETTSSPQNELKGHSMKVNIVRFHPLAQDVVVSTAFDNTLRIWDTGSNVERALAHLPDQALALDFSADGTRLAVLCKDRSLHLYDARSGELLKSGVSHEGVRGGRVAYLGDTGRILTTGFDRASKREVRMYDAETLETLGCVEFDVSPAILDVHFDEGTGLAFLSAKGDTSIRVLETANHDPWMYILDPFMSVEPQQGVAFLLKTECDVRNVEVARALKLTQKHIETVTFTVPRTKKEYFQDDLYPPVRVTWKPVLTSAEFFAGETRAQETMDVAPSGMLPVSQAPVDAPKKEHNERANTPTSSFISTDQKKDALMDRMVTMAAAQSQKLEQDSFEGVDDDEWDD